MPLNRAAVNIFASGLAAGGKASTEQAQAGTDDTTAMTPLKSAQLIDIRIPYSLGTNGWVKINGGMILQWGSVIVPSGMNTIAVTFPVAFPSTAASIVVTNGDTSANVGECGARSAYPTGFVAQNLRDTNNMRVNWMAIGY